MGGDVDSSNESGEVKSQVFRIAAIGLAVPSALEEFKKQYEHILEGDYHEELVKGCSSATLITVCQKIAREYIYCSPEILKRELAGQRVIRDLMDIFWEGVSQYVAGKDAKSFPGKIYELISPNYRKVFETSLGKNDLPPRYYQMRLVTDYICGMTDSFACNLHKELTNG